MDAVERNIHLVGRRSRAAMTALVAVISIAACSDDEEPGTAIMRILSVLHPDCLTPEEFQARPATAAPPAGQILNTLGNVLTRFLDGNNERLEGIQNLVAPSWSEQLIGCFINTHVLRTQISNGVTARNLLAQVRTTVLESLSHADIPFERLVNELLTERDLSRSPVIQTAFILQNTPASSEYEVISGGTDFDLTLYMWESNGLIGGSLEFNPALFEPETIAAWPSASSTRRTAITRPPHRLTRSGSSSAT